MIKTMLASFIGISPDHPLQNVHHETFPMPSGNVLAITWKRIAAGLKKAGLQAGLERVDQRLQEIRS